VKALHLTLVGAIAAAALSHGEAESALRSRLHRLYGIEHSAAVCHRKSTSHFACRWRGRRGSIRYSGHADVRRSHGTTVVVLRRVHSG
jgi:hypothetical protein